MCYAKPGPRCFSHANERYESALGKTAKAREEMAVYDRERNSIREEVGSGTPTQEQESRLTDLTLKSREAVVKYREAHSVQQVLLAERDATKIGLENFKEQFRALESDDYDSEHYPKGESRGRLEKRFEVAKEVYKKSIESYDDKYGTVDGRQASPYGSAEGIEILRDRMKSVRVKIRESLDEKNRNKETIDALMKEHNAIQEQFNHAHQTKLRVESGKIDKYRASLAGNKSELNKTDNEIKKTRTELEKARDNYRTGPERAFRNSAISIRRFRPEDRTKNSLQEHERLRKEASDSHNKEIQPLIEKIESLEVKKRQLKKLIIWGEMGDEEREGIKAFAEAKRKLNVLV